MREITARDAKNRFDHLLDPAQSAPVRVTKKGRPVGVMMSVQQYERLRGAAWTRVTETVDRLAAEAAASGLTDARLFADDQAVALQDARQPVEPHRGSGRPHGRRVPAGRSALQAARASARSSAAAMPPRHESPERAPGSRTA